MPRGKEEMLSVFLVRPCYICNGPTIHKCCLDCINKCTHNYQVVYQGPFADVLRCEDCGNTSHSELYSDVQEELRKSVEMLSKMAQEVKC